MCFGSVPPLILDKLSRKPRVVSHTRSLPALIRALASEAFDAVVFSPDDLSIRAIRLVKLRLPEEAVSEREVDDAYHHHKLAPFFVLPASSRSLLKSGGG